MTNNKAMKMSEIVLVKYLFHAEWEQLEDAIEASSGDFGDIYELYDDKEVMQVAKTSAATLIIACVRSKDDLTKVLNFLKNSRKIFKDSNLKISVLNYLQNKNVEMAFMKLGCQEVLDPNLKSKQLKFKMEFWKKSLAVSANKRQQDQNKVVKDSKNEKDSAKKDVPQIKWGDPLKLVDDMWITKNPQYTKRILNRWMIKLMGPSPFVAQWIEVDGQKGLWQFVFKDGIRDTFHMSDGDWFFRGEQKPEFVWKENLWLVSGQKIQLFYQEGETVVARFRTNQEHLEITKNSNYALSREKAIVESFDQEVLVKKGLADNSKTSVDADQKISDEMMSEDIDGNDNIEGFLKGKNAREKKQEDKKHNVGRDELNLDNLEGEGETDDLGKSHYDGKIDHENLNKKNREGINAAADSLFDEDGNAATEDVGVQKYKGKLEHGHNDRKSDYGGKSETDDLGSSHYSNRTDGLGPAKKSRSVHSDENELDDEDSSDNPDRIKKVPKGARKSSTDVWGEDENEVEAELESEAIEEVRRNKERLARTSKKSSVFDDEDTNDDEEEESIDKKALNKKKSVKTNKDIFDDEEDEEILEKRKEKVRAPREKGAWSEDETEDYDGKGSTDDLGPSHYEGRKEGAGPPKKDRKPIYASNEDHDESEDELEEDGVRPISKKAIQQARRSQGTEDLGKSHYAGKVTKKSTPEHEDSEDEVEEKQKEKDLTSLISKERLKGKINNRSRSELDELESEEDEEELEDSQTETHAKARKEKKVKKAVIFADESGDGEEGEEELDGAGGAERLRAAKAAKSPRSPESEREREKSQQNSREKRIQSLDDLLPDGNAEDPQEDVLPKGEVSDQERQAKKIKQSSGNEEADNDQEDSPEKSVKSKSKPQANLKLVSNLETPATSEDGKPIVNENAKVKAILKRDLDPNSEILIVVDDFFDNTAIIKTLDKRVQLNEMVSINVVFEYMKKSKTISIKGKCIEAQHDDEDSYLTLELNEQDTKIFEQFMRLYELRQSHVTEFMKAARGY